MKNNGGVLPQKIKSVQEISKIKKKNGLRNTESTDVPDALWKLSLMEQLLLAICLPLQYRVKLQMTKEGCTWVAMSLSSSGVPVETATLWQILHLGSNLMSQGQVLLKPVLWVCKAHVVHAIMCLPFHNCYYMEVKLNAHELMMLQEDAMPEWTIQEFVETRGDTHWW